MVRQPVEKAALLIVDVQDSFKVSDRWEKRSNLEFESNLSDLLGRWRDVDLPRFFILHNDEDPGFRPGDAEVRLMEFLERDDDEPLLFKNTRNSFTSTDLHQRLQSLGVTRVVITGISTEQCCETTTRVAADLGYDVDFVTEATLTFPIVNSQTGEQLSTRDIIHRTEFVLRNRFARISTVNDLRLELEGAVVPSRM